jgi:lipopolysaccharide assembly protein A
MRVLQVLVAIVFIALGVGFSALNADPVVVDLYFSRFTLASGVLMILALLLGAVLGGVAVVAGVVWPLRRRLRKASRQDSNAAAPGEGSASGTPLRP